MELGTSIFLSAVLLSLVILYGITRDRWKWRSIFARVLQVSALLFVCAVAAVAVGQYWHEVFPTKMIRQTQYAGIKLGMTQDEVMYTKGFPPFVLAEELKDPQWKGFYTVVETKNLEKGKRAVDYRDWSYREYEHNINVTFNAERTAVVQIQCYSNDKLYRCPPIGGVKDGDSEKEATRRFGEPGVSKIEGVAKTLTFPNLGITLTLTKEQIYMMSIGSPGR